MNEALLIVLTILLSGFFSGSEIGFVAANRLKLEIKSRKDSVTSRYLKYFVRNPEIFLSTTLVGNNVVNIAYATLMTLFLTGPIALVYAALIGADPSDFTVILIQTVIASMLILIFGEIIPKSIFRSHSDRAMDIVALPLAMVNIVLRPIIWAANTSSQVLIRLIKPDAEKVTEFYRREDIETLFREIGKEAESDIDRDDSEILSNVLEMSSKRVRESMIPRIEIHAVDIQSTIKDVLSAFTSSGYSKLPVYEGNIDNIVGVVFAYDLFKKPKELKEIIRPVKHVPSSQKCTDLLSEFKRQNISLAVVIDEYGGTAGLVTIEDLIEEVVGDIQDEYDNEATIMKKLSNNTFIFSGDVEIEDIEDEFPEIGMTDEDTSFETIAGYIINEIGRIPKMNEEVIIDDRKFIITKSTDTRIEIIKLILLES